MTEEKEREREQLRLGYLLIGDSTLLTVSDGLYNHSTTGDVIGLKL